MRNARKSIFSCRDPRDGKVIVRTAEKLRQVTTARKARKVLIGPCQCRVSATKSVLVALRGLVQRKGPSIDKLR